MRSHAILRPIEIVAIVAISLLAACASHETPPPALAAPAASVDARTIEGDDRIERTRTVEMTATVKELDHATRRAVLLLPEGREVELVVGEQVTNLASVRVGDQVRASYQESLVFQVRAPGEAVPGTTGTAELDRALPGENPSSQTTQVVTVTTTVTAIDRERQTITLLLANGRTDTLPVQNPANLDKVKVGELLEITYREAFAIALDKQ